MGRVARQPVVDEDDQSSRAPAWTWSTPSTSAHRTASTSPGPPRCSAGWSPSPRLLADPSLTVDDIVPSWPPRPRDHGPAASRQSLSACSSSSAWSASPVCNAAVRWSTLDDDAEAVANARDVLSLQRTLGLDWERAVQDVHPDGPLVGLLHPVVLRLGLLPGHRRCPGLAVRAPTDHLSPCYATRCSPPARSACSPTPSTRPPRRA